jgi:hypothetical protein
LPTLACLAASLVVVCGVTVHAASADDDGDEVPVVGRPSDLPFSGASGRFTAEARAAPVELEAQTPLTFTLTVKARGIVRQPPQRLDLRQLPAFEDAFYIEDGEDRHPDGATWKFTYRLKPRRPDVTEVPGLPFVSYDPALARTGKGFQVVYTDPIALRVRPHAAVPVPLKAPATAFEVATGPEVLVRPRRWPGPGLAATLVVVLAPPAVCAAWWLLWRRWYPDLARRTQQRRSRAARRALYSLQQAGGLAGHDLAARAAAVMTEYLHERLDLAPREPTPAEAQAHLVGQGLPPETAEAVGDFYRACDAARFLPELDAASSLTAQAEKLVLALEEALCPLPPS